MGRFLGVMSVVVLAMTGLTAVDLVLARMERAEVREDAARHFRAGQALMAQSSFDAAADEFRTAVSVARENRAYRVAWAQASYAAGRFEDAEEQANQLLDTDFSDGDANLLLARIYAREGRAADAIFSYRRAIYGRWPNDAKRRRTEVRWELTALLSREHASDDLLAELLLILGESPDDPNVERRVAHLYLEGGPVDRAIPLFEDLVQRKADDADAVEGLGQAYLLKRDCSSALPYFRQAARLGISDAKLGLCEAVAPMDASAKGLAPQERLGRAKKLLEAVQRSVSPCGARPEADRLTKEPYEQVIEMARKVWMSREAQACLGGSSEKEAISFLLRN